MHGVPGGVSIARDDAHMDQCLNCGTALIGSHCHACGQSGHVHRSLGAIGHELAHGVFHFEGKIWRTLPMLVFHPGALTRRYVQGERARFVSPLALFLFTVFLMFALYSQVGPGDLSNGVVKGVAGAQSEMETARARGLARMTRLERERASAVAARSPDVAKIDARIAELRRNLAGIAVAQRQLTDDRDDGVHTGWHWLDEGVAKARANPGLVAYKVQSSAYKYSWALILLSTPFVALLFLWRRRFHLYDHSIFVTYSIAFMSLLVIVVELSLLAGVAGALVWTLAVLAPPVHMFVQLRGAYSLSRFSAAWRTVFLLSFAIIVLTLYVLGLVAMGISH